MRVKSKWSNKGRERTLDEIGIGRQLPFGQVKVVLETNAHIAADGRGQAGKDAGVFSLRFDCVILVH